ncbi:MAG: hypothetical protein ACI8QS_002891 [Planctomycetota bacterium]|jgi:hypothetical protein
MTPGLRLPPHHPLMLHRTRHNPILLALILLLHACGGDPGDETARAGAGEAGDGGETTAAKTPASGSETRAELRDLVIAITPAPASATAGFRNDWFGRKRAIMERLRMAGPEFGAAVLAEFHEQRDGIEEVRIGLLDVAAHCQPAETEPILLELISNFGDNMGVRTVACDLLARTAPATALATFTPILLASKDRITYPPEERILKAWIRAADHEGAPKGEFLGDLAVQMTREHSTRQTAVRELANCEEPAAVEALKTIMVESSGNHLLRRTAAQSLLTMLPREDFCAHARQVFELESDQGFQVFLSDMINDNCGQ